MKTGACPGKGVFRTTSCKLGGSDAQLDATTLRGTVSRYRHSKKKAIRMTPKCCQVNTVCLGDGMGLRLGRNAALVTDRGVSLCPRVHSHITNVRVM